MNRMMFLPWDLSSTNLIEVRLFDGLSEEEISRRLRDRQFPDLSSVQMPLRRVIEECWTVPGYRAEEAVEELRELMSPLCMVLAF